MFAFAGAAQCDSSREFDPAIRAEVLKDRIKGESIASTVNRFYFIASPQAGILTCISI